MPPAKNHTASPVPTHRKRRGEWAEMKFMTEAAARGLTVLKPYGDCARFDFAITRGTSFLRVQVKCTSHFGEGAYRCGYFTRLGCYSPEQTDVLAAYVIPCDAWYIIPADAIPRGTLCLNFYPHRAKNRGRYENFRNAWRLLLD